MSSDVWLWGFYEQALLIARESGAYLKHSQGTLHSTEHYFYLGLILATRTGLRNRRELKKIIKKFKKLSRQCPENFLHKYLLLSAERARLRNKKWEAAGLYNQAIESAYKNDYLHIGALANELAGKFFLSAENNHLARNYLQSAYFAYRSWGALARSEALLEFFPEILTRSGLRLPPATGSASAGSSRSGTSSGLDLDTVMKATRTLSREIKHAGLLESFMKIIIENAGAQRGFFISLRQDRFVIEAEGALDNNAVTLRADTFLEDRHDIPQSIIKYIARTKSGRVLENAVREKIFSSDPAIKTGNIKSVLCAPILQHGELLAIVYLENNLSEDVFTSERLELVTMLSAQAAISLENAKHYDLLERKVRTRTIDLEKEREKSDKLLLNTLPRTIAEELKDKGQVTPRLYDSVSIMFTDFKDFSEIAHKLNPGQLLFSLDRYFTYFDEICGRYNLEKLKTIGDSYMCAGG